MAATVHFESQFYEPKADTFGHLTFRAPKPLSPAQRLSRNHLFIALACISVIMTGLSALYVVDRAAYPAGYSPPAAASHPMASLDYD